MFQPFFSLFSFASYIIYFLLVWALIWKGWALWVSARRNEKIWFIILLVINTLGLLEIFYLFIYTRFLRKKEE
ncbi:MAG: DUF5652 family protein [Minisyncoccia bacterium]